MTTRMVSPRPLSDFVPVVTLIAFPIPAGLTERLLAANNPSFRGRGDCPDSDNEGEFRRKAEFALADLMPRTFRRLSAAAQSRRPSKLHKLLIYIDNYKLASHGSGFRQRHCGNDDEG